MGYIILTVLRYVLTTVLSFLGILLILKATYVLGGPKAVVGGYLALTTWVVYRSVRRPIPPRSKG